LKTYSYKRTTTVAVATTGIIALVGIVDVAITISTAIAGVVVSRWLLMNLVEIVN
jgi:hypothetical protein